MSWEDLTDEDFLQSIHVETKLVDDFEAFDVQRKPSGLVVFPPQCYGQYGVEINPPDSSSSISQPVRILKRQDEAQQNVIPQTNSTTKVVPLEERQKNYLEARKRIFQT